MKALKKGQKVFRIKFDADGCATNSEEQGFVVADQKDGGAWATVLVQFDESEAEDAYRIELRADGEVL